MLPSVITRKKAEKRKREPSFEERRQRRGAIFGSYSSEWSRDSSDEDEINSDEEDSERGSGRGGGGDGSDDGEGIERPYEEPSSLPGISSSADSDEEYASSCDELEEDEPGEPCFGCAFGRTEHDPLNPTPISSMMKLIDENYGMISNIDLARSVHLYYRENILNPARKEGKTIGNWRTKTIKEHITSHTLEPRISIGESIRRLATSEKKLFQRIFDEEGKTDHKTLQSMLHTIKLKIEVYKQNTSAMSFYNKDRDIDLGKAGSLINFKRQWDHAGIASGIGGGVSSFGKG